MNNSRIQGIVSKKKAQNGDNLVDTLAWLSHALPAYKVEDLLCMPRRRLNQLINWLNNQYFPYLSKSGGIK